MKEMTKEEAQARVSEWQIIEKTSVWQNLEEGLHALIAVHNTVLRKSLDEKKIYRSQGAVEVANVILKAKENQLQQAIEVLEGKKRGTGYPARS